MAWARIDDSFYDHPKIVAVWDRCPGAIGLHARALAYATKHLTNGRLPGSVVAYLSPCDSERTPQVDALVEGQLWYADGTDYLIHDFLDWNPSKDEVKEKRRSDRERKRESRSQQRQAA